MSPQHTPRATSPAATWNDHPMGPSGKVRREVSDRVVAKSPALYSAVLGLGAVTNDKSLYVSELQFPHL